MLQLRQDRTHHLQLLRKASHTKYRCKRLRQKHDRRRKRRDETHAGFCHGSMKDSPSSLIPEQCIYKDLVPLDYVSLNSIIYEMKHDKVGKI